MPDHIDLAEVERLAEEAAALASTFTDSEGIERKYTIAGADRTDLTDTQKAEYREWWERQVEANQANHSQMVAKASKIDYDAFV